MLRYSKCVVREKIHVHLSNTVDETKKSSHTHHISPGTMIVTLQISHAIKDPCHESRLFSFDYFPHYSILPPKKERRGCECDHFLSST